MAEDFVGIEIATIVVTASIVLAGIFIGVGRAFSYKKIENFGLEEFFQSLINAAIVGAFAAITELIDSVSAGVVEGVCGTGETVIEQLTCIFESTGAAIFSLLQELIKLMTTVGYYQTISLDFDILSIQPFANLSAVSVILSGQTLILQLIMVLINLNTEILNFIGQNALLLIFPIGLVFRTFFATRRVGAFLIGLAIGMYLLYPSFIMIFPSPEADIANATANITAMNHNVFYSTVPVIDLTDNAALATKLDIMSGRCFDSNSTECLNATANYTREDVDFVGDLTVAVQVSSRATAKALMYLVVAPLLSLIITIIFVNELTKIMGGEIGIGFAKMV